MPTAYKLDKSLETKGGVNYSWLEIRNQSKQKSKRYYLRGKSEII